MDENSSAPASDDERVDNSMSEELEEDAKVKQMISGGTSVIVAGMVAGLLGWILCIFASRPDIGIGASGYGLFSTVNSFVVVIGAISGGFNQSIAKYVAEGLVESDEKGLDYSRGGSITTLLIGIVFFSILIVLSIVFYLINLYIYSYLYTFISIAVLFSFIRDNLIGNLAGVHKFGRIGLVNFFGAIGGILVGLISILFIPPPWTSLGFASQVIAFTLFQVIFSIIFINKYSKFNIKSIYKFPSSWDIAKKIGGYGFYCTIPQVILSGSIFWIQTVYYQFFLSPTSDIVGISGIIIGYSGVMSAISFYGWPQVPAVSEAKAQNNQKLIDKLVSQVFRTGFNVSIMFLVVYIGLAHPILELFHTAEYLPGYVPFILLSISTTLIGLTFIIASMLIGLGEAKIAFIHITVIIIGSLILTPILITIFINSSNAFLPLYAGPLGLLIPTLIVLPLLFRYLPRYTNRTSKFYLTIILKGTISVATPFIISLIIENFIFPYNTLWNGFPIGFLVGALLNIGIFIFLISFLSALDDKDWELFNSALGPLKFLTAGAQWLSNHSPFSSKQDKNSEEG